MAQTQTAQAQTMTPTRHEKLEWARMAQAMYGADRNDLGHRMSGAAALREGQAIPIRVFDELQGLYRSWLVLNRY